MVLNLIYTSRNILLYIENVQDNLPVSGDEAIANGHSKYATLLPLCKFCKMNVTHGVFSSTLSTIFLCNPWKKQWGEIRIQFVPETIGSTDKTSQSESPSILSSSNIMFSPGFAAFEHSCAFRPYHKAVNRYIQQKLETLTN